MAGLGTVQSLHRGMRILRLLAKAEDGIRVSDAARTLGVKPPTAHALLQTLVADRFAAKHGTRYHLGPEALELSRRHAARQFHASVTGAMQELAREIPNGTVSFAVPRHDDVTMLYRVDARDPGTVEQPVGRVMPLYNCISGLVLLAHADAELRQALERRHPFVESGIQLWAAREALDAMLARITEDGFGVFPFDDAETVRAAVPIIAGERGLAGVLGIYARQLPSPAAGDAAVLKLRDAAAQIVSGSN